MWFCVDIPVTFVEQIILLASSSERTKFINATNSARTTLTNFIAHLEPFVKYHGVAKFELRVVYKQFTMKDGSKCAVFNYATITGYYDKYGNKFMPA